MKQPFEYANEKELQLSSSRVVKIKREKKSFYVVSLNTGVDFK